MLNQKDGEEVRRNFMGTFQDAYLKKSRQRIIPSTEDGTLLSHFYRIIHLMDLEIEEITSPRAISKELIISLLQSAANLYEGDLHAKEEATDLIRCKEFQTILRVGIQDQLSQCIHEQWITRMRFHGVVKEAQINHQKIKARQLYHRTILVEQIASLCSGAPDALQDFYESARMDEPFILRNYTKLIAELSLTERSWLATLLPHIFRWIEVPSKDSQTSVYIVVARPALEAPTLSSLADLTPCDHKNMSSHESPLRSNFDWSFLDEDDPTELFRLSPDPYYRNNTNMVNTKSQSPIHTTTRGIQATFALASSSKAVSNTQMDVELFQLLSHMRLRVKNHHTIHRKILKLLKQPVPMPEWLKTLQKSTLENRNLSTVATLISVLKIAIESTKDEADKKERTLWTIIEESQEQLKQGERGNNKENKK